jgi:integrase
VLAPTAIEALRKHRAAEAERRLRVGEAWQTRASFSTTAMAPPCSPRRSPTPPSGPPRWQVSPGYAYHDLRHAVATLPLGQGTHPQIVSEMLGHSSIAITLDTYSHVLPTMGDVAALAIQKAFSASMEVVTPAI